LNWKDAKVDGEYILINGEKSNGIGPEDWDAMLSQIWRFGDMSDDIPALANFEIGN